MFGERHGDSIQSVAPRFKSEAGRMEEAHNFRVFATECFVGFFECGDFIWILDPNYSPSLAKALIQIKKS